MSDLFQKYQVFFLYIQLTLQAKDITKYITTEPIYGYIYINREEFY